MTATKGRTQKMPTILAERLREFDTLPLLHGQHEPDHQFCVMEAIAYVAGEKHSDHPKCASRVIGAFLRNWNDSLPDDGERGRLLKPLIPTVVGTATSKADEETRAWLATDWLVRVQAPAWLDLAKLPEQAAALRALPPLTTTEIAVACQSVLEKARQKADAAGAAARAVAWAAAWDAVGAALHPTVTELQASAVELVKAMAAVGR